MHILFVCTGNICRSPMAEFIGKALAQRDEKLRSRLQFSSAGVFADVGWGMTAFAQEALSILSIPYGAHSARQVTKKMLAEADMVFAMGLGHLQAIINLEQGAAEKTHLLKGYGEGMLGASAGSGYDIADPYGQSLLVYQKNAMEIKRAIEKVFTIFTNI